MDITLIICPNCSQDTPLEHYCVKCKTDLRLIMSLHKAAAFHYNGSINLWKAGDIRSAFAEITKAVDLFPDSKLFLSYALSLACEIGYYNEASAFLKRLKPFLSDPEFVDLQKRIKDEVEIYNQILHDSSKIDPNHLKTYIHKKIWQGRQNNPIVSTHKDTPLPLKLYIPLSLALIFMLTVAYQTINLNRANKKLQDLSFQSNYVNTDTINLKTKPSLADDWYLSSNDKIILADILYKLGRYDMVLSLKTDTWHSRSSDYFRIKQEYFSSKADSFSISKGTEMLLIWMQNNAKFPSHYGDAAMTILKCRYAKPDAKLRAADLLMKWLSIMPDSKEYQQYNNAVLRRSIKNGYKQ